MAQYLKNIAIVGASGTMGKHIAQQLLATKRFDITAITRPCSTAEFLPGIKVSQVDYSSRESLVSALKGKDALIITLAVSAPKDTEPNLVAAAIEAKIPWIMNNEWGYNSDGEAATALGLGTPKQAIRKQIAASPSSSWIGVSCGFWYEFSLGSGGDRYGFDIGKRTVTLFDEGTTKIDTSTWHKTAAGVVAVLSLPVSSPSGLSVKSYKNKFIRVSSFELSQMDMLAAVQRATNTTAQDWTITKQAAHQRFDRARAAIQKGDYSQFGKMLYSRYFFTDDSGNFTKTLGNDNDKLGLEQESLDQATARAVEFANDGYSYTTSHKTD